MLKKYIGDKQFYRHVLGVAIPIMIQNGITNFVSLLDNIMIGQVGTEQMSGVAIANQLMFVFNICIFGSIAGAGIFSAQYFGCGDHKGVQNAFRLKIIICIIMTLLGVAILGIWGTGLIGLFLHEGTGQESIEATLLYGKQYLSILMISMLPFAIEQAYSSTLRETGETVLPMKAGIVAVLVNLCLNYLLIFGKFGFPQLGVEGAAIATVIARFVEMSIIISWTHIHKAKNQFIAGVYRNIKIPGYLVSRVISKGAPLTLNEILWASGQAVLIQCYSVRGLSTVAALNISSTLTNIFNIVFIATGSTISIIIGQLLGAGKMKEAKDTSGKLIFFTESCCIILGIVLGLFSLFFPDMYNTSGEVKALASSFIIVSAIGLPIHAFMNSCYFMLRSGGQVWVTFLFDSVFLWVASIPLAFLLSNYTAVPIVIVFFLCQMVDIIKCVIGIVLIRKEVWLKNIIAK